MFYAFMLHYAQKLLYSIPMYPCNHLISKYYNHLPCMAMETESQEG